MKKTLKTKILDIVPAKCDSWIICDDDIFYSQTISDLDIFDSLITCDLWHLIFLYKIISSPWYPSVAVLQTFKNDCCACIWDHRINWIELNWIRLVNTEFTGLVKTLSFTFNKLTVAKNDFAKLSLWFLIL